MINSLKCNGAGFGAKQTQLSSKKDAFPSLVVWHEWYHRVAILLNKTNHRSSEKDLVQKKKNRWVKWEANQEMWGLKEYFWIYASLSPHHFSNTTWSPVFARLRKSHYVKAPCHHLSSDNAYKMLSKFLSLAFKTLQLMGFCVSILVFIHHTNHLELIMPFWEVLLQSLSYSPSVRVPQVVP
jgi:hypothetical protein